MIAVVVFWLRKMRQQPDVGNGLEEKKRTCAAKLAYEPHGAGFADFHREEKRNDAVIEPPVALAVVFLDEFDGVQEILFDLCKSLCASVYLNARDAQWQ